MAATVAPMQNPTIPPADVVGNAFVHQYYLILRQSPELVHRFYQDDSKLGRPEGNGIMSTTTTMQAINEKILSLVYEDFKVEILTVDSQESYNGGVLVLVTGYLTGNDDARQKFTQSFFLAPQEKGYFVLNDVFRFVDEAKVQNGKPDPVDDVEVPATSEEDSLLVKENHILEQGPILSDDVNGGEVYDPSDNGDASVEEEEVPVAEVLDEVPEDSAMAIESQVVTVSDTKIEDVPKKSYASIVKVMKENAAPFSLPVASPLRSAQRNQEQLPASAPPSLVSEPHALNSNGTENVSTQDMEAEGPSIYVKGLPFDATHALIENEFKKFGTIRAGGIQVRNQKGFCFGFVEFEAASSMQSAIEASPIMINGCRVVVEEKRSTARGNGRGRFSSGGGGGYRNDGVRGRGGFGGGGRAYGRGGSGSSDYGSRSAGRGGGGFLNRGGGEGFRRSEKMGNGGGRMSSSGGPPLNVAGNTAPHVSATA